MSCRAKPKDVSKFSRKAGRCFAAFSRLWFVMAFGSQQKYQPLDLLRKGWMDLFTAEYIFSTLTLHYTLAVKGKKERRNTFLSGGFYVGIVLRWITQEQQVSNWKKIVTTHVVWQSTQLGPREGHRHLPKHQMVTELEPQENRDALDPRTAIFLP